MDPIEDAEKESSALALETFQVRFEEEEGEKTWADDFPSGRDGEVLPKVGLISIKCSSLWLLSEESGEPLTISSLSFDEFDLLG